MKIQHEIEITAPPERVWELTVDVGGWPAITPTMTKVERLGGGPIAPGSSARVKQPGQRARVWTVSTVEPNECFAWHARVFGTTMTGTHTLIPSASGTTNILTLDLAGPLAAVVGTLVGRAIRKSLATENAGFKAAAES